MMIFSISAHLGRVALCAFSTFALLSGVEGLTPAEWRSQSIYQVLTDRFALTDGSTTADCDLSEYCGGSWRGIIDQLSYIQDMGFTAIWISPVSEQIYTPTSADGNSYHGYWPQNIYEVNTYFGAASDLVALSDALHARGMYLMVDVVPDHMAYDGCGECVNYTTLYPFNEQSYYHPFCLIDDDNTTSVEVCWEGDNIVALPDLRTESTTVVKMFQTWIEQLVANYTIDGLRIDSAIEMDQAFLTPFQNASGVFNMAEVYNGDEWEFCTYQDYVDGALNYPAYFWIIQAFESTTGSISTLSEGLAILASQCSDISLLGNFIENHDQPRFPSLTSDMSLTKNAIGFSMLNDGIPIIYQGQEQHYSGSAIPDNREDIWSSDYNTNATLYTYITLMNKIRSLAISADSDYLTDTSTSVYTDSNTIVMRKGSTSTPMLGVWNNRGASGNGSFTLTSSASGFSSGVSVTELISCKTYTTDSSGDLNITVTDGLPQVYYLSSLASAVCPSSSSGSTSSTSTSSITSSAKATTTMVTSTKTTSTKTTSSSCVTSTSRPIAFEVNVTNMTSYSFTNVQLVGSVAALRNWNTSDGIDLTYDDSNDCDLYWFGDVDLTPGTVVEYKYINIYPDGYVEWEADPNHTYTVPSACTATAVPTITDTWQT